MAIAGHMMREMLEHYSHVRMAAKRGAVAKLECGLIAPIPKDPQARDEKPPQGELNGCVTIDVTKCGFSRPRSLYVYDLIGGASGFEPPTSWSRIRISLIYCVRPWLFQRLVATSVAIKTGYFIPPFAQAGAGAPAMRSRRSPPRVCLFHGVTRQFGAKRSFKTLVISG
jgi:hypothetical protein